MITIDATVARRSLLALQGLGRPLKARLSRPILADLIQQMGFVQVDSVKTVERAHHMILFSRNHGYKQHQLVKLLEKDRALFENWTHDASVIPSAFFPYWRSAFETRKNRLFTQWKKHFGDDFSSILDEVYARVQSDGPTRARDVTEADAKPKGGWWNWAPNKVALEYLWRTGRLAVTRRDGFEKVYDLAERVIPPDYLEQHCDRDALVDWACRAALDRLGFATPGELASFWDLVSVTEAKTWADHQLSNRTVLPVVQTSFNGRREREALTTAALLDAGQNPIGIPHTLRIISPFDPVIRDRKRLKFLFNFDYRIEIFVPEEKRQYGYYVFPILEKDRFAGRIDMKVSAGGRRLEVRNIWWENWVRSPGARLPALMSELEAMAAFTFCGDITLTDDPHRKWMAWSGRQWSEAS